MTISFGRDCGISSFQIFKTLRSTVCSGGAGEFKAGAFRIAIKTGVPVVPVAISGARGLFEGHGLRATPGDIRVRILPAIQTAGMSKAEQKQLPDAVRQTILAQL